VKAPLDARSLRLAHTVQEQRIDVRIADPQGGHSILDRLGELNRTRLLPLIERVFDEFDRPGEIIRIPRLDLDLGHFGEGDLGLVEARLEAALREALARETPARRSAADGAGNAAPDAPAAIDLGTALVQSLEHYLLHGSWAYGASLDPSIPPADLLALLIDSEGAALVDMLRRHEGSESLLHRLVRQMPGPLLERLLHRLDPDNAAYVVAYMGEAKASHDAEPLIEATPDEFAGLLWTIVLRDALHSAGLRANRRAFVENLVARLAEAGGMSFADLCGELQRGLEGLPAAGMGPGSLLSILREIAGERVPARLGAIGSDGLASGGRSGGAEIADAGPVERLALLLNPGSGGGETLAAADLRAAWDAAWRQDASGTRRLLRRLGRDQPARLVERLRPALSAADLLLALRPAPGGEMLCALAEIASLSADERTRLVALAAAAAAGALPANLAEAALAELARWRGLDGEQLRLALVTAARRSGGSRGGGAAPPPV
jgi:hypothetical protein